VVIAIIGILAATVLSSLGDARVSGIVAKTQGELDAIAKRANIDQVNTLTYDTACGSNGFATSTAIMNIIASIESIEAAAVECNSNTSAYALSAPIREVHWCVDSTGVRKEIPDPLCLRLSLLVRNLCFKKNQGPTSVKNTQNTKVRPRCFL